MKKIFVALCIDASYTPEGFHFEPKYNLNMVRLVFEGVGTSQFTAA